RVLFMIPVIPPVPDDTPAPVAPTVTPPAAKDKKAASTPAAAPGNQLNTVFDKLGGAHGFEDFIKVIKEIFKALGFNFDSTHDLPYKEKQPADFASKVKAAFGDPQKEPTPQNLTTALQQLAEVSFHFTGTQKADYFAQIDKAVKAANADGHLNSNDVQ